MSPPSVTIVIPAWNEERDLPGCLAALAAQDYGHVAMNVVVADGRSSDATADLARASGAAGLLSVTVVDNPARRTSAGLNRALAVAGGEIIVRVDVRSRIVSDYVSTCVAVLSERPEVGVVGGAQIAEARSASAVDQAIARALRNRWTTGLSRYRRATTSGPADTVWMGAFRRDDLVALGGWNEEVALNEDFELNQRYRRSGKVVWFESSLRSGYLPRRSVRAIARQHFRFGTVKGKWWARGEPLLPRHAVLLAAPPTGVAALMALGRRLGWPAATAAAAGGAVAVDALGAKEPAPVSVRVLSSAMSVTMCGSWWLGVPAGYLQERSSRRRAGKA